MLATGGSAIRAMEVLREHQVPEERITFISLVSAPEGIRAVHERSAHEDCDCSDMDRFPHVKLVTAWIVRSLRRE